MIVRGAAARLDRCQLTNSFSFSGIFVKLSIIPSATCKKRMFYTYAQVRRVHLCYFSRSYVHDLFNAEGDRVPLQLAQLHRALFCTLHAAQAFTPPAPLTSESSAKSYAYARQQRVRLAVRLRLVCS